VNLIHCVVYFQIKIPLAELRRRASRIAVIPLLILRLGALSGPVRESPTAFGARPSHPSFVAAEVNQSPRCRNISVAA